MRFYKLSEDRMRDATFASLSQVFPGLTDPHIEYWSVNLKIKTGMIDYGLSQFDLKTVHSTFPFVFGLQVLQSNCSWDENEDTADPVWHKGFGNHEKIFQINLYLKVEEINSK